jgi:hypothetical protein
LTPGFLKWCHVLSPAQWKAAVADRASATREAGERVSDECMAMAVRSTRRDGIAAWRWRYPGSPRDHLAYVLAFFRRIVAGLKRINNTSTSSARVCCHCYESGSAHHNTARLSVIRTRLANALILEKPSQPATPPALFTTPRTTKVATTLRVGDGIP